LHLRNGESYRRDSNGYPHIFHHALFTQVTSDIVRQLLLPYIDMADTKPEVVCNFGTGRAIDALPKATTTFFHHTQFTKVTGDVVRQHLLLYIDMADTRPEVFLQLRNGMNYRRNSNVYPDRNVATESEIVENVGIVSSV
jgi:hypothetical protein